MSDFVEGWKSLMDDQPWLAILVFIGVPVTVTVVFLYQRLWKLGRGPRLRAYADRIGLAFDPRSRVLENAPRIVLFHHCHRVKNLMSGSLSGDPIRVYDQEFAVTRGRSSEYFARTVAEVNLEGHGLPDFALFPEGFVSGLLFEDIDFASAPIFSNEFWLNGSDERRVRNLFNEEVLGYFTRNPGFCLECDGRSMFLYPWKGTVHADQIDDFLRAASEIVALLTRPT